MSNQQSVKTSLSYSDAIKVIVTFGLMFGFGYLPPIEPLDTLGMQVLGIFMGLLFAWTCIGFIWPSLLSMVALGMTGYLPINKVFLFGFGDLMPVFVFLVLVYTNYLEETGLMKKVAYWFLSRKICIGRPWVLTLMILVTAYILGWLVGVFAAIFIMWEIFYNICYTVGYQKGEAYPAYMVCGIVISAMLGLATIPFKAVPLLTLTSISTLSQGEISIGFLEYFSFTSIISVLILLAYFLFCKLVLKLDVSKLDAFESKIMEMREQTGFDKQQKIAFASLIIFVVLLFIPSILPKSFWLAKIATQLNLLGALSLILITLMILKKDNKPLLSFQTLANKNISWDMIIMLAATMTVSHALTDSQVGILAAIEYYSAPIISSLSPMLFGIIVCIGALILTQLVHNLMLAVVLLPVVYTFGVALDVNLVPIIIIYSFVLGVAMFTPAASSMGALIYTNKEWINMKRAYFATGVTVLMTIVIVLFIAIPLSKILF